MGILICRQRRKHRLFGASEFAGFAVRKNISESPHELSVVCHCGAVKILGVWPGDGKVNRFSVLAKSDLFLFARSIPITHAPGVAAPVSMSFW